MTSFTLKIIVEAEALFPKKINIIINNNLPMFILGFLAIVVGGSLILYALRAPTVGARVSFESGSRELFLLFNNVILVIAALMAGTPAPDRACPAGSMHAPRR